MRPETADLLNSVAPTWLAGTRAALLQGTLAFGCVGLVWLACRKYLSNTLAHGLFLIVPVKTAAAALFVAWPVVISFSVPLPESLYSAICQPAQPDLTITTTPNKSVALENQAVNATPQPVAFDPDQLAPGTFSSANAGNNQAEMLATEHFTTPVTAAPAAISASARLMIAWAIACGLLLLLNIIKHARMMRQLARARIEVDQADQTYIDNLASELHLRWSPRLFMSGAVATPAVVGLVRPRLVVPLHFFTSFDTQERRWILLHELAHIRRRDLWWLAFERLSGILFFYHPALWLSGRATRHFRELACDDLAQMQSGLSPRQCAETFLKLILWTSRNPGTRGSITPTLSLTDRYPAIQRRIMNMTELNNPCRSNRLAKISIAFIMATAILISLPWSPKLVAQSQVSSESRCHGG